MKINILPSSIYNKIAAGEVVENAASVVKELVENSIDAGATSVSIYIEGGGLSSICVVDNGSGIERNEIEKTIMPHATSKINHYSDLYAIKTLGFRGEALASISSVSELEICTKHAIDEIGVRLHSKEGEVIVEEHAHDKGTSITILNLFYNTPARLKFLKSPKVEAKNVSKTVTQLAFANPDVALKLVVDGKTELIFDGGGLHSAIYAAYGSDVANDVIEIKDSTDYVSVFGYITTPNVYKSNKTCQTFILNGRVVENAELSATMQNACSKIFMFKQFPVFVLTIRIDEKLADINVHPAKRQVRFEDSRQVCSLAYRSTARAYEKYFEMRHMDLFDGERTIEMGDINRLTKYTNHDSYAQPQPHDTETFSAPKYQDYDTFDDDPMGYSKASNHQDKAKDRRLQDDVLSKLTAADDKPDSSDKYDVETPDAFDESYATNRRYDVAGILAFSSSKEKLAKSGALDFFIMPVDDLITNVEYIAEQKKLTYQKIDYKTIGQLFDTYLMIELKNKVLILDQHAAHERVIYDNLFENFFDCASTQLLLPPYELNCTVRQIELLSKIQPSLTKLGLETELRDSKIIVNTLPTLLNGCDIQSLIYDIIKGFGDIYSLKDLPAIRERLAKIACRKAVKGNTPLTELQIDMFIDYYLREGAPITCPHGRPTVISLNRGDLEQLFRRRP